MSRIKLSHQRGETAPNTWDDIAWIREKRNALYEKYGEIVVLVYQQAVIGKGKDIEAARADAETNLAPEIEEISPVIAFLSPPSRISKVSIQKDS